jgi:uncharacterized membrane protein (UPF0127 family)
MNHMRQALNEHNIVQVVSLRRRPLSSSGVWRFVSLLVAFVATLCLFMGPAKAIAKTAANQYKAQPQLPTIVMLIDGIPLTVELAANSQQRYMGLSFRQFMDSNSGMLFVYPGERKLTFTMRNTLIPLSIAYISEDMVINEIHHMNVGPGQLFDSRTAAKFALEVNQGWFEENGIKPGAAIVLQ